MVEQEILPTFTARLRLWRNAVPYSRPHFCFPPFHSQPFPETGKTKARNPAVPPNIARSLPVSTIVVQPCPIFPSDCNLSQRVSLLYLASGVQQIQQLPCNSLWKRPSFR